MISGVLICGSEPAANVRIKLWDEDSGPDPDDLLDQGYSTSNGSFFLSGWTTETTPIDPVFKIYHDCNDERLVSDALRLRYPIANFKKFVIH